jgi:hypothetical protein
LSFPGLRVILRVDAETRAAGGERSVETRYFATSLDPGRVTPGRLLDLVRGHWQVENCLHFEKDRWWDEDRHVCRRPGLAERFTALMSAAVSVLRAVGRGAGEPVRARADALNWDIGRAINVLTGSHL